MKLTKKEKKEITESERKDGEKKHEIMRSFYEVLGAMFSYRLIIEWNFKNGKESSEGVDTYKILIQCVLKAIENDLDLNRDQQSPGLAFLVNQLSEEDLDLQKVQKYLC